MYITLQSNEYQCSQALSLLSPLFSQWGPYIQFFDRLVPLLTQKKELPKEIIVPIRKMIHQVKELNSFFSGKIEAVRGKLKSIALGTPDFIPTILNNEGYVKSWQEWSESFDLILDHPRFIAFSRGESSDQVVYDMIDMTYKIETDMNKITAEGKAITDAKWTKNISELEVVRNTTWPFVDTDIAIWEVIADIKAIPSVEDD
jgi:hypothetical protein